MGTKSKINYKYFLRVLGILLLVTATALSADQVVLKSGRVLKGKIIRQNRSSVYIKVGGRVRVVKKSSARSIRYGKVRTAKNRRGSKTAARRRAGTRRAARVKKRRIAAKRKRAAAAKKVKARKAALAKKERVEAERKKKALALLEKKRREVEARKAKTIDDKRKADVLIAEKRKQDALRKKEALRKQEILRKKEAKAIALKKRLADEKRKALDAEGKRIAAEKKKREAIALKKRQAEEAKRRNAAAKRKNVRDPEPVAFRKKNQKREVSGKISSEQSAFSSALLPGLGQWQQGRRGDGVLFGTAFAAAAFLAYDSNRQHESTSRSLENVANPSYFNLTSLNLLGLVSLSNPPSIYDPLYISAFSRTFLVQKAQVDRHAANLKKAGYAMAGIYLFNVLDAYFFDGHRAPQVDASKALLYSSFAPGLGQWKSGRRSAGMFIGALALTGLTAAYDENQKRRNAKRDLDAMQDLVTASDFNLYFLGLASAPTVTLETDPYIILAQNYQENLQRKTMDGHANRAKQFAYFTLGLYLYNLADAYFFHPEGSRSRTALNETSYAPQFELNIMPETGDDPEQKGVNVRGGIRFRF